MSRSCSYHRCAALVALAGAVLLGPAAGVAHAARADFAAPPAAALVAPPAAKSNPRVTSDSRAPRAPQVPVAQRPGRREERASLRKSLWGTRVTSNEGLTAGIRKAVWGPRR